MDWNTRCRVCSARKGQKRVESLGVRVSDLRSSVTRMDLGKARHSHQRKRHCKTTRRQTVTLSSPMIVYFQVLLSSPYPFLSSDVLIFSLFHPVLLVSEAVPELWSRRFLCHQTSLSHSDLDSCSCVRYTVFSSNCRPDQVNWPTRREVAYRVCHSK